MSDVVNHPRRSVLERIADRVTNVGEDLVYLQTGAVEELG
jgi:phosphate uptake regulator